MKKSHLSGEDNAPNSSHVEDRDQNTTSLKLWSLIYFTNCYLRGNQQRQFSFDMQVEAEKWSAQGSSEIILSLNPLMISTDENWRLRITKYKTLPYLDCTLRAQNTRRILFRCRISNYRIIWGLVYFSNACMHGQLLVSNSLGAHYLRAKPPKNCWFSDDKLQHWSCKLDSIKYKHLSNRINIKSKLEFAETAFQDSLICKLISYFRWAVSSGTVIGCRTPESLINDAGWSSYSCCLTVPTSSSRLV